MPKDHYRDCNECNSEYDYEDRGGRKLCYDCMRKKDLKWDCDEKQFVPEIETCYHCGGAAPWCSVCNVYTSTCCVDYGTCMCS